MNLLTNGRVITRDEGGKGYYEKGAVAYEGTKIVEVGEEAALRAKYPQAEIIDAKVLSNRRPPYSVTGGRGSSTSALPTMRPFRARLPRAIRKRTRS